MTPVQLHLWKIFQGCFMAPTDLRLFVAANLAAYVETNGLLKEIRFEQSHAEVGYSLVLKLTDFGLLAPPLIKALRDARPGQQPLIDELERLLMQGSPVYPTRPARLFEGVSLQWNRSEVQRLHRLLSEAYWDQASALKVLRGAGMKPASVRLEGTMDHQWQNILESASKAGRLLVLLRYVLEDEAVAGIHIEVGKLMELE